MPHTIHTLSTRIARAAARYPDLLLPGEPFIYDSPIHGSPSSGPPNSFGGRVVTIGNWQTVLVAVHLRALDTEARLVAAGSQDEPPCIARQSFCCSRWAVFEHSLLPLGLSIEQAGKEAGAPCPTTSRR
jgi:hypothetical protein